MPHRGTAGCRGLAVEKCSRILTVTFAAAPGLVLNRSHADEVGGDAWAAWRSRLALAMSWRLVR
jgi:hypothetical protein